MGSYSLHVLKKKLSSAGLSATFGPRPIADQARASGKNLLLSDITVKSRKRQFPS
jgi:hypothetical protein